VSATPKQNFLAAGFVVVGMIMISSNDTIMKLSSAELSVGQLLFVRGGFAVMLFAMFIKLTGREILPAGLFAKMNLTRAFCECAATVCFITSLTLLPIAIASALVWITPLLLTVSAALILRERVLAGRWLAVVLGFIGVLLVTNPFGEEFSSAMGLPLLAALFVCIRDLATRRIDQRLDSVNVVFVTLVVVTIAGFMMSIGEWQPVSVGRAGWLCLSALLLGCGFLLQIKGVRLGDLSFIAPFSYTGILAAVFYGYLVWDELPGLLSFAGILLIVCSGIYVLTSGRKIETGKAHLRGPGG